MLCLLTLADVEAVSPETLTPLEGGAALAALRRHLQLADAQLRRRPHRPGPGRRLARSSRSGPPISSGGGDRQRARRACRGDTCSCSIATPSTSTSACRATCIPTKCTCVSSAEDETWELTVVTQDKPYPVREHLRRAVVVRHGHPAGPRA